MANPHGNPQNLKPGNKRGPSKTTKILKEAILQAAEDAGGEGGMVGYLTTQARENPASFMPLLGKVLPMTVASDPDQPLTVEVRMGARKKLSEKIDAVAGRTAG